MAIWQYDIEVIPVSTLERRGLKVPCKISDFLYQSTNWWGQEALPENFEESLTSIIPLSKCWSNDIKQWGLDDETCIQLVFDDRILVEFDLRLDLRTITYNLLNSLLCLINQNEYVLLVDGFHVVDSNLKSLLEEIRKSKSFSFFANVTDIFDKC